MMNFYIVSKRISALFICVFLANILLAQRSNIQGRVTDNSGNPLSNVSVLLKGSTIGSTTSSDGSYTISVPNSKSVLVFSYVGYQTMEETVGNKLFGGSLSQHDSKNNKFI